MTALTLTLIRLAFLAVLWLFVIALPVLEVIVLELAVLEVAGVGRLGFDLRASIRTRVGFDLDIDLEPLGRGGVSGLGSVGDHLRAFLKHLG